MAFGIFVCVAQLFLCARYTCMNKGSGLAELLELQVNA